MTVAAIAYRQLSSTIQTKVDTLLTEHPDFEVLSQGIPSDDPDFGLRVFMCSATFTNHCMRSLALRLSILLVIAVATISKSKELQTTSIHYGMTY